MSNVRVHNHAPHLKRPSIRERYAPMSMMIAMKAREVGVRWGVTGCW